jgi:hypothetical protein
MYSMSELSQEERKYLFCRASFAEYASQVESFEHTDSQSMIRIAEQRSGATEPMSNDLDRTRAQPSKYHWMLSRGQCGRLKIDSRFILSSEDFAKMVGGEKAKDACRYCITDFLFR